MVLDYGKDRRAHGRPGMAAIVGFSRATTTPLHAFQVGESSAVEAVERGHHVFVVGLIVCDEYGLHNVFSVKYGLLLFDELVLMSLEIFVQATLLAHLATTVLNTHTGKYTVEGWDENQGKHR